MSWFDTASFATLAKTALNTAQKQIDRALDIDESESDPSSESGSVVGLSLSNLWSPTRKPETLADAEETEQENASSTWTSSEILSKTDIVVASSPVRSGPSIVSPETVTSQVKGATQIPFSSNDDTKQKLEPCLSQSDSPASTMDTSNESVGTVQGDLEYSMLDDSNVEKTPESRTPEVDHLAVPSTGNEDQDDAMTSSSLVVCSVGTNSDRGESPPSESSRKESDHTSGDEGETTTSSDIEIINSPYLEVMSDSSERHTLLEASELLNTALQDLSVRSILLGQGDRPAKDNSSDDGTLRLTNSNINELLHAREQRVLYLSSENCRLQEENDILQSKLKGLQALQELPKALTQKISKLESNLQEITHERDRLKAIIAKTQEESSLKVSSEILAEKEVEIEELRSEGVKLSKEVGEKAAAIKKLRSRERELQSQLKSREQTIDEQSTELERLRKSMNAKDEQEKRHIDAIRQLKTTLLEQENEICGLKVAVEDLRDRLEAKEELLSAAQQSNSILESAKRDLEADLQRTRLSAEMATRDEIRQQITTMRDQFQQERQHLLARIDDLETTLAKSDVEKSKRETALEETIGRLQKELMDWQNKNQELTLDYSNVTQPLLKQIEMIQSTHENDLASSEKELGYLTKSLKERETELFLVREKERTASAKCEELSYTVARLETEIAQLAADKEKLASRKNPLEEEVRSLKSTIATLQSRVKECESRLHSSEAERLVLTEQAQRARRDLESERERNAALLEQLRQQHQQSPASSVRSLANNSDIGDDAGSVHNTLSEHSRNMESSFEAALYGAGPSLIDSLQAHLKMKDGEIRHLNQHIARLEALRDSLSAQLVAATERVDIAESELGDLRSHEDLTDKYNTLLQMYGEKVEEAEELRMDLEEATSVYKAQITELTRAASGRSSR